VDALGAAVLFLPNLYTGGNMLNLSNLFFLKSSKYLVYLKKSGKKLQLKPKISIFYHISNLDVYFCFFHLQLEPPTELSLKHSAS